MRMFRQILAFIGLMCLTVILWLLPHLLGGMIPGIAGWALFLLGAILQYKFVRFVYNYKSNPTSPSSKDPVA